MDRQARCFDLSGEIIKSNKITVCINSICLDDFSGGFYASNVSKERRRAL